MIFLRSGLDPYQALCEILTTLNVILCLRENTCGLHIYCMIGFQLITNKDKNKVEKVMVGDTDAYKQYYCYKKYSVYYL